jgi:hypothetical protein
VEGVNQIQIVAGSGNLSQRSNRVTQRLLSWLYHPQEPSCGWVEEDGIGVAFRRTPTGRDSAGRSGAYFAHALVWQQGALSTDVLARLWDAEIWMTRPPESLPRPLEAVQDVADLGLGSVPELSDEQIVHALAHLLDGISRGRRAALELPADVALPLAATMASRLPARFGLLSFSSSEAADTATRYDVVAGTHAEPFESIDMTREPATPWRLAAELLNDAAQGKEAADVIAVLTERAASRRDFARAAGAWAQIEMTARSQAGVLDRASADVIASDSRLMRRLNDEQAIAGLARSIAASSDACVLLSAGRSAGMLDAMLDAIGDQLARLDPHRAFEAVWRMQRIVDFNAPRAAAALRSLETLDVADAVRLARLVIALPSSPDRQEFLSRLTNEPRWTAALFDELPVEWRARAAAAHPDLVPASLLIRAAADVRFASTFVRESSERGRKLLIEAIGTASVPLALPAVEATAGSLAGNERLALLWPVLPRLPARTRLRVMETWAPNDLQLDEAWLIAVIDAYVETVLVVRDEATSLPHVSGRASWVPISPMLPRADQWLQLARALRPDGYRQRRLRAQHVNAAVGVVAKMASAADRDAALEVIVDACADYLPHGHDPWSGAMHMVHRGGGDSSDEFAQRISRTAQRPGASYRSGVACWTIYWVAEGLESRSLSPKLVEEGSISTLHTQIRWGDVDRVERCAKENWSRSARKWLQATARAAKKRLDP